MTDGRCMETLKLKDTSRMRRKTHMFSCDQGCITTTLFLNEYARFSTEIALFVSRSRIDTKLAITEILKKTEGSHLRGDKRHLSCASFGSFDESQIMLCCCRCYL